MPVDVIPVQANPILRELHLRLYEELGQPKFADREGKFFYPHMTVSWHGHDVVDAARFEGRRVTVRDIWIIKDYGADSVAFARIPLAR